MHVVHISSVHNANDPRIRRKQLAAVSSAGWRATLVSGDLTAEAKEGSARIVLVKPGNRRRWQRVLLTSPHAIMKALLLDADIYHLHDPELVPWALLLRLKGRPVVYDIHEDYVTSVEQKQYVPRWMRGMLASAVGYAERILSAPFHRVIAEKYYSRRFPDAVPVLNYPSIRLLDQEIAFRPDSNRLLYTGNVTVDRGALHLARLASARPDLLVKAMGRCAPPLAEEMHRRAGSGALSIVGTGRYVPFEEILQGYKEGWLAGLALFPPSPHYREKELTKFFEYMAVGLPVVASDFPVWRELLEGNGVGLCVDPEDPKSVGEALDWLRRNPVEAAAMGHRGRDLIRKSHNWEAEGSRLIEFYRRIAPSR